MPPAGEVTLFADYGPALEAQVWITPRIRVDFLWREVKMILEYDGKRRYSLRHDREDDRTRDHDKSRKITMYT